MSKGSFPCGSEGPTLETRSVVFTKDLSCDHCVLEWIWSTPEGKLRQCADIMIASGEGQWFLGLRI